MVSFTYDSDGVITLYFFLSVAFMILVPFTYFLWPRTKNEDDERLEKLRSAHVQSKWFAKEVEKRRNKKSPVYKIVFLLAIWSVFFYYVWQALQIEVVKPSWDPYAELGIEESANKKDIRKAYKKLSIEFHPDKCDRELHGEEGCEEAFLNIKKAYDILHDEEKRKDWHELGKTEENVMMQFGIALPEWIVKKENSYYVLGAYVLCFMIILPSVVGSWWYKSIRFNSDKILLSTSDMFQHLIFRSPTMQSKKLIQIISVAHEFSRFYNKKIKERPSDNATVPKLLKALPNSDYKQATPPYSYLYAVKVRGLIYGYLYGIEMDESLQEDLDYMLSQCTPLLNEMIQIMTNFIQYHQMGRMKRAPTISTFESAMKLSASLIQAVPDGRNPIFQLPHFNDRLVSFLSQKKKIKTIKALAALPTQKRKEFLSSLNDNQFDEITTRLRLMPDVDMKVNVKVEDDDDQDCMVVTAGSLVTFTVDLTRNCLGDLINKADETGESVPFEDTPKPLTFGDTEQAKEIYGGITVSKEDQHKTKVVNKRTKFRTKKTKKVRNVLAPLDQNKEKDKEDSDAESYSENTLNKYCDSNEVDSSPTKSALPEETSPSKPEAQLDSDDEEWERYQQKIRPSDKGKLVDTSRFSHTVLAPKWPVEKQEQWWIYITDVQSRLLYTNVQQVYNLVDKNTTNLQFAAPRRPGIYKFKVQLRSDSYLDCDRSQEIRLYISPSDHVKAEDADEAWGDLATENEDSDASEKETDEGSESDGSWIESGDEDEKDWKSYLGFGSKKKTE